MRGHKSHSTHKRDIHHVVVSVPNEPDLLKRAATLHMAAYKIIQGTKLIQFISSDYENGKFEFLIEGEEVIPSIVPADVVVKVDKADPKRDERVAAAVAQAA